MVRRDACFIRIGNKHYPSYLKASKQYSTGHLPPINISRIFLESITIIFQNFIFWNQCINNNSLKRNEVQISNVKNMPTSTTTIIDNSPVLSSKYLLLESLSIATSDLKNNPLHVIKLNNIKKELACV